MPPEASQHLSTHLRAVVTQLSIPVDVPPQAIARKKTLGQAIDLCAELGGREPKEIQLDLKLDKAQFSRWSSGGEGIVWPKLEAVMDYCGNDAPVLWQLHQRGYDLFTLRKRETERERENRLLREENAALRRVLQGYAP